MATDPKIKSFSRLVGNWITEATHPLMPDVVVHGTAEIAWLEGEHFLINRARTDHKDFPDAISIIGDTSHGHVDPDTKKISAASAAQSLHMHYFDDRGVFRNCETSFENSTWRISFVSKGFSQRFAGTLTNDDTVIDGLWQMSEDDVNWKDDLKITYRLRLPR